jgi:hypothetical protein
MMDWEVCPANYTATMLTKVKNHQNVCHLLYGVAFFELSPNVLKDVNELRKMPMQNIEV